MRIIDYQHALKFITEKEIAAMEGETLSAKSKLVNRTGRIDFTGWVDYPLAGEETSKSLPPPAESGEFEVLLVITLAAPISARRPVWSCSTLILESRVGRKSFCRAHFPRLIRGNS